MKDIREDELKQEQQKMSLKRKYSSGIGVDWKCLDASTRDGFLQICYTRLVGLPDPLLSDTWRNLYL